jgi:signal transduction histidine kinase
MSARKQNETGTKVPPGPASRAGRLVRPLLYAGVVVILVFGCYEVLERTLLAEVEMGTRHAFHAARGIFSSLLVAVVVGWMILRSSPGILRPSSLDRPGAFPVRLPESERTKTYAQWFIAMRWIAVLLSAILVFISVQMVGWLPQEVWWPLMLTVGALAVVNVLFILLLRWGWAISPMLLLQAHFDLFILAVLLHFSGGIENPLSMMMIFHVIIGGILLSRRQCYGLAATASALFALLAWGERTEIIGHYTLQIFPHPEHGEGELFHPAHHTLYATSRVGLQAVVLFLTGYFVTTLAERLRENERGLSAMANRALADRQLLERALQTTGTGLRVLELDLQAYWASNWWKEWFVCRDGEICAGCELLDRADSPARQCLHDGRVRVTELVIDIPARAGNSPRLDAQRVFQVTTAPLLDLDGKIAQIVELAQDVTEQKKTQARILQAGKLAAVGELAGQVAHEVNNPVSIISAKASLLLSDHRNDMSAKVAQELGKITELAKRAARVAQGLLSYCRPSAATRVQLDLRVPIRKAFATVEERARREGAHMEDRLPAQMPTVKANANELEQVFLNLFLNALDSMPKGGWLSISALSGEVGLREGKPAVGVVVADTGCGMTDEVREKVFEPFFTTKTEGRGTGLGLSICLGVIRSHGGELDIESKLWQGTRVTIKLPVDAPAVKEEDRHG